MAAIAYPTTSDWHQPGGQPRQRPRHLRVVPPRNRRAVVLRRRRTVAAVAGLVVMALAVIGTVAIVRAMVGALGGGPLTSPEPRLAQVRPIAATEYVVQPGDTLWSIARAAHPAGDVRPYVDRMAGRLHGQPLRPGQRIEPP